MANLRIFTIGFAETPAEIFFGLLQRAHVKRLVDVRLHNTSQLAGFSKRDDLRFFAQAICRIEYVHVPTLAPTQAILDAFKKRGGSWQSYEQDFVELLSSRHVEEVIPPSVLNQSCLLCSEKRPDHCHRRLVAEYFQKQWTDVEIEHLF